jgi:hypothetical protein
MSLADLINPPVLQKRKGKIVSGMKRDIEAEQRKAKTLAAYEARQRELREQEKRERMKALNADPDFKAKLRATASERMKALHADPDFKAKQSERMKALHADPDFKAKVGKTKAATRARKLEQKIEQLKRDLINARKDAGEDIA